MRPYGIVVFPEGNKVVVTPARAVEHGVATKSNDDDNISQGSEYPTAVFFETEHGRDAEMEQLLKLFPNVMFCPVFLTIGKKTQPNPKAADFTISERGVLPA